MDQEQTPQQAVPPGELAHLTKILRMVNEELEENCNQILIRMDIRIYY